MRFFDESEMVHDFVGQHPDELGPGILLVGLPLLLEDGPDAVQRTVELIPVLETEVQLPILQRIHHIRHLLNILPAGMERCQHRRDDRDDDDKQYDMPQFHR